jgi:hypothetical protein
MPYTSRSTVVAFSGAKQASLYCEHVVPLTLEEIVPIRDTGEPELFDLLQVILPPSLVDLDAPRSVHPGILHYVASYLCAFPQVIGVTSLPSGETFESRAERDLPGLYADMARILESVAEPINGVLGLDPIGKASAATDDVACQLAGLNIIDVGRVSWRHLIEFRKDTESVRKLQNLRVFFHHEFDGKSREYVQDALLLAIEKHDDTVRTWGFETISGALECIFSSRSVAALAAGAITLALGAPTPAGLIVGAALEIGSVTVKVVGKRRSLSEFRKYDPVS